MATSAVPDGGRSAGGLTIGPVPGPMRAAEDRPESRRPYFPLNVCRSGTTESAGVIFIASHLPSAIAASKCHGRRQRRTTAAYRCLTVLTSGTTAPADMILIELTSPTDVGHGQPGGRPPFLRSCLETGPAMPCLLRLQRVQKRRDRIDGRDLHCLSPPFSGRRSSMGWPTSAPRRVPAPTCNGLWAGPRPIPVPGTALKWCLALLVDPQQRYNLID